VTVGVADGVVEFGTLLADVLLAGVLLGAVAAGAVLAAGELLVPAVVVLLVGAVTAAPAVLVDGVGDGLAGAALPMAPPPRVVPWPGSPWTMADSGLPEAPSTRVTAMAQPMNAAAMTATGCAGRPRGLRRCPG
jgi:hypothetical protein